MNEDAKAKTVNNELRPLHSAILSINGPDVFMRREIRNRLKLPEPDPGDYIVFLDDAAIARVMSESGTDWFLDSSER